MENLLQVRLNIKINRHIVIILLIIVQIKKQSCDGSTLSNSSSKESQVYAVS